jgi:hypothetical protein
VQEYKGDLLQIPFLWLQKGHCALKRKGVTGNNHKKVAKLMKSMNIQIKKAKRYTRTTNNAHNLKV